MSIRELWEIVMTMRCRECGYVRYGWQRCPCRIRYS